MIESISIYFIIYTYMISSQKLDNSFAELRLNAAVSEIHKSIQNDNIEKRALMKILQVFAGEYLCSGARKERQEYYHDDRKINLTSRVKLPHKLICFPKELNIVIYAASAKMCHSAHKCKNDSGLQIFHVEESIQRHRNHSGNIDTVVVVDIFPYSKFGHPVVIYQIHGTRLLNSEDDVVVERVTPDKADCERLNGAPDFYANRSDEEKRFLNCHYHFIPTVSLSSSSRQLLRCIRKEQIDNSSEIEGLRISDSLCGLYVKSRNRFITIPNHQNGKIVETSPPSSSPQIRESSSSSSSRASKRSPSSLRIDWTRPKYFQTSPGSCHLFTICDHALVISGGWKSWSTTEQDVRFSREFIRMLRRFGFPRRNILFFNGFRDEKSDEFYREKSKREVRKRVKYLCGRGHCVNSLVVYLNAPTLRNGDMLLGDENNDGLANESTEIYSVKELSEDLRDCRAQQVVVVADQSNSDRLVEAFKESPHRHELTAVFASGRGFLVPIDSVHKRSDNFHSSLIRNSSSANSYFHGFPSRKLAFTATWLDLNHTTFCVQDVFQESKKRTHPDLGPCSFIGAIFPRHNIYGAPCNSHLFLSKDDLEESYFGCQNLPRRLVEYRALKAILPEECGH